MGTENDRGRRSLRAWRLDAGLALIDVALRAHVSRGTVRKLENGGRSLVLDREVERRVAKAVGVPFDSIAWGAVNGSMPTVTVEALRKAHDWTEADLAARACVPIRTVRKIEAGAAIHPRYAKALADFFGVRVTDIYPHAEAGA